MLHLYECTVHVADANDNTVIHISDCTHFVAFAHRGLGIPRLLIIIFVRGNPPRGQAFTRGEARKNWAGARCSTVGRDEMFDIGNPLRDWMFARSILSGWSD